MSRQFDIVRNPDPDDAAHRPYLLVLQADRVSGLRSTVVAPLVVKNALSGAPRLNPLITLEDGEYWLATHELFAVDRRALGKSITSLTDQHDTIMSALDFLFIGS
jgi:toxin CcdB